MSSIANKKNTQDSDEIDLGRIIGELIDHRKLIITISVFFTAVAIIYALFATPVYQADS
ncbi:Wzz/FepE/Etk N-terminal domain-containing protein [Klebsiella oxytoca]|nr:Wzz/FepE/Etk N-terminal domain-containing protein [Klebsiella oxytoca]